jgi:uncharacterized membrane protein YfcA
LSLLADPAIVILALTGVFTIAFMKGVGGGGAAGVGIPLLALAMDPLTAGALLAPLLIVMDVFALRYFSPSTWSMPDVALLLPALIAGIGTGYLALNAMNPHMIEIVIAVTTLGFAVQWLLKRVRTNGNGNGASLPQEPSGIAVALQREKLAGQTGSARSPVFQRLRTAFGIDRALGLIAGFASGVTTMVAHAGGPPITLYLLRRGLPKSVLAGTMSIVFSVGNVIKLPPWLLISDKPQGFAVLMAICLPIIPFAVWLGWRLHNRLSEERLQALIYAVLAVTSLKLLWNGVAGLG